MSEEKRAERNFEAFFAKMSARLQALWCDPEGRRAFISGFNVLVDQVFGGREWPEIWNSQSFVNGYERKLSGLKNRELAGAERRRGVMPLKGPRCSHCGSRETELMLSHIHFFAIGSEMPSNTHLLCDHCMFCDCVRDAMELRSQELYLDMFLDTREGREYRAREASRVEEWIRARPVAVERRSVRGVAYAEYLASDEWQVRRGRALELAGHRCQLCNGDIHLQVHHRTYERVRCEEDGDLTVLCRRCHGKFHDVL